MHRHHLDLSGARQIHQRRGLRHDRAPGQIPFQQRMPGREAGPVRVLEISNWA